MWDVCGRLAVSDIGISLLRYARCCQIPLRKSASALRSQKTRTATAGEMLILSNRGQRFALGMPKGVYRGYDREISEVYVFRIGKG